MIKDDIIEEVRSNREKLFAKYNNEISVYVKELYKRQKLNKEKYISRPNKKSETLINN